MAADVTVGRWLIVIGWWLLWPSVHWSSTLTSPLHARRNSSVISVIAIPRLPSRLSPHHPSLISSLGDITPMPELRCWYRLANGKSIHFSASFVIIHGQPIDWFFDGCCHYNVKPIMKLTPVERVLSAYNASRSMNLLQALQLLWIRNCWVFITVREAMDYRPLLNIPVVRYMFIRLAGRALFYLTGDLIWLNSSRLLMESTGLYRKVLLPTL